MNVNLKLCVLLTALSLTSAIPFSSNLLRLSSPQNIARDDVDLFYPNTGTLATLELPSSKQDAFDIDATVTDNAANLYDSSIASSEPQDVREASYNPTGTADSLEYLCLHDCSLADLSIPLGPEPPLDANSGNNFAQELGLDGLFIPPDDPWSLGPADWIEAARGSGREEQT